MFQMVYFTYFDETFMLLIIMFIFVFVHLNGCIITGHI